MKTKTILNYYHKNIYKTEDVKINILGQPATNRITKENVNYMEIKTNDNFLNRITFKHSFDDNKELSSTCFEAEGGYILHCDLNNDSLHCINILNVFEDAKKSKNISVYISYDLDDDRKLPKRTVYFSDINNDEDWKKMLECLSYEKEMLITVYFGDEQVEIISDDDRYYFNYENPREIGFLGDLIDYLEYDITCDYIKIETWG